MKKGHDLKKLYGMTIDEFDALGEQQSHLCAICQKPEGAVDPSRGKPRKLAVDHCHKTGRIRSLLCTNCNTGLGRFCDDPELLRRAIDYLARHEELATK